MEQMPKNIEELSTKCTTTHEFHLTKLQELLTVYREKLGELQKMRPEQRPPLRAIELEHQNTEISVGLLEMTKCSSKQQNKVYSVLLHLISETRICKEYIQSTVLRTLNFYSEGISQSTHIQEGDPEVMIGRISGFLSESAENLSYINRLILNTLAQIHALSENSQFVTQAYLFDTLGSLFGLLAQVDAVVSDNENLVNHWEFYKRMMHFARSHPEKYRKKQLIT